VNVLNNRGSRKKEAVPGGSTSFLFENSSSFENRNAFSSQSETEALDRDRVDLEGVRECALEEAHAIQRERMELEEEKAALAAEVDSVQEAARHAQVCA
jgi:hypothetical protein